jgi:hypothetical protein
MDAREGTPALLLVWCKDLCDHQGFQFSCVCAVLRFVLSLLF